MSNKEISRLVTDDFMLPDWLPKAEWKEFLEHRRRKRAPVTETIAKRVIAVLNDLRMLGYAPADVLTEAIDRNWTGIKLDWIHKGGVMRRVPKSHTPAGEIAPKEPPLTQEQIKRNQEWIRNIIAVLEKKP